MGRITILYLIFLLSGAAVFAQGNSSASLSGIQPKITHYSRSDFQADAQFWTMTRDNEGILYFGNNDGVMIYNGESWHKLVLPNHSSVRSLMTAADGTIYAGGFNELGVIEKDSLGEFRYNSLLDELKLENSRMENLWQVHEFQNHIIYRSFSELLAISGQTATHISSQQAFLSSGIVRNNFFVQDSGLGIMQFDPVKMVQQLIFEASNFQDEEIRAFLPAKSENEILLVGKSGNIYKGNPSTGEIGLWVDVFTDNQLDQIISVVPYKNDFLLGTLSSRIIILTSDGVLDTSPPAFAGVSNSSVLNLYREGENIWALLNNGLDLIEFDTPVTQLFASASIYDILVNDQHIYLATNQGVFSADRNGSHVWEQNFSFEKVPDLEGQAWSLNKVGESVIVGHDKGLYLLEENTTRKIGDADGFWKILKIRNTSNKFLAANYHGLYLLTRDETGWILNHKLKGFEESTRDILQADQDNTFWVCHGYKGVYKLKINADHTRVFAVEHYTDQNGLESPFNINVTRWNEDIVFTTNTGIYQFQEKDNQFIPYKPLNNILNPDLNTRRILKHDETVWVVQDDEIGWFQAGEQKPDIHKNLFLNLKGNLNRGMEAILPLEKGKVLVGATSGLYLFDTQYTPPAHIPTRITRVKRIKGEEEFQLPITGTEEIEVDSQMDLIRFEFAAPLISPSSTVQYQYILEGIEEKWSAWEDKAYKEYTHLPAGDYIFRVKSRDLTGNLGEEARFEFQIPPVWYKTPVAYISYFLIILILASTTILMIKKKLIQERHKLKEAAQMNQKVLELQIEQLKLEKDKESIKRDKQLLEEENMLKSKELANYTMMLVKKKDVFTQTYENLQEFRKTLKTQAAKKRLQEVLLTLNQHRIGEEYMTVFDVHFEKVHKNFFKELKAACPELTKRELRLCAFIKMDLSNKEIAPLLNISVRGVETARYRIRKKLQIQEVNFCSFLEKITSEAWEPEPELQE